MEGIFSHIINAILDKIDPSLERISQTLSQLREYLVLIHSEINALNGLVRQFDDLVNEAKNSIDGFPKIMMQSATRAREYILRAAAENGITQGADQIIRSINIFDDSGAFSGAAKTGADNYIYLTNNLLILIN